MIRKGYRGVRVQKYPVYLDLLEELLLNGRNLQRTQNFKKHY